jgi:hypothetical protein
VLTAFLFCLLSSGPTDEVEAARAAYKALPDDHLRKTTLFVSFLGVPDGKALPPAPGDPKDDRGLPRPKIDFKFDGWPRRPHVDLLFHVALNGVTFRKQFVVLEKVEGASPTLYKVDTEDLEWKEAAVGRLIAKEPYFRQVDFALHGTDADYYQIPLIRADWFGKEATFGDTYYDLLDFGKTLNDLDKKVGLNRNTDAVRRAQHGARVVKSGVSKFPRTLARLGSIPAGDYWQTDDLDKGDRENIFRNVDRLTYKDPAAHEIFGSLPNKLKWWALANNKFVLQNAAPIAVARETRKQKGVDTLKDIVNERITEEPEIQTAHSCLGCHALGLRTAPDYVAESRADGKLRLQARDRKTQTKIDDFFDVNGETSDMKADSTAFVDAVRRLSETIFGKNNSLEAADALRYFAIARWYYAEERLDHAQAARELNVDEKTFDQAARASDQTRLDIALWFLNRGDKVSAQAVLGLNNVDFQLFLAGKPNIGFGSDTLRTLNARNTPLTRDLWELGVPSEGEPPVYLEATLLICYQVKAKQQATADQVREKAKALGMQHDLPRPQISNPPPDAEPKKEPARAPEKPPEKPVKVFYNNEASLQRPRQRATDRNTGRPIEFDDVRGVWIFSEAAQ